MSVVISNVLMACAVVALGFSVFYWAQQRSLDANLDYANTTEENIAGIKEKIVFEYIFYNISQNELTVFLINCGKSNNVSLARVYLSNDSWTQSFDDIELSFLNDTLAQDLDILDEGYFQLSVDLSANTNYSIRIVTKRGRFFVTTFVA